jgi:hypothetical protein
VKKATIVVVAILTLIAMALLTILTGSDDPGAFLGKKREPASAAPAETPRAKRLSSEAVLSISPGLATGARPAVAPKTSALLREFTDKKNYPKLHERLSKAASRSAEESWVFAKILEECAIKTEYKADRKGPRWALGGEDARRRFMESFSEKDPNRSQRIAAFEQINYDQCAGIADIEVSDRDIRKLLEEAVRAGDPKARVDLLEKEIWDTARGPDGKIRPAGVPVINDMQIEGLKVLASSGDPYAVFSALALLGGSYANMSLRSGPGETPVDRQALWGASQLVACDYGYPCGSDTRLLLVACAYRGQCGASDYREFLFYYQSSPSNSQTVAEYEASLSLAVRTGDWSYFTYHRGPPPNLAPYQAH